MNNYQLNIHKNLGDKVEVDLAKKQRLTQKVSFFVYKDSI